MKKLTIMIISLFTISCQSDEGFRISKKILSSITITSRNTQQDGVEFYLGSTTLTISENKLTKIVTSNSYQVFEYSENLVTKRLEYNLQNQLISLTNYTYDGSGRITKVEKNELENPHIITNETTYNQNKAKSIWKGACGYLNPYVTKFSIDEFGQLLKEDVANANDSIFDSYDYNYSNGNLVGCLRKGSSNFLLNEEENMIFNYAKGNKNYYKKFMFGADWKINSAIENSVNFFSPYDEGNFITIDPETSDELILSYGTEKKFKVNYAYTYDNQGDVISQSKETTYPDGRKYKTTTNYNYAFIIN